jgi:hypothetical protein
MTSRESIISNPVTGTDDDEEEAIDNTIAANDNSAGTIQDLVEKKRHRERARRFEISQAVSRLSKVMARVDQEVLGNNPLEYTIDDEDDDNTAGNSRKRKGSVEERDSGRGSSSSQNRTDLINSACDMIECLCNEVLFLNGQDDGRRQPRKKMHIEEQGSSSASEVVILPNTNAHLADDDYRYEKKEDVVTNLPSNQGSSPHTTARTENGVPSHHALAQLLLLQQQHRGPPATTIETHQRQQQQQQQMNNDLRRDHEQNRSQLEQMILQQRRQQQMMSSSGPTMSQLSHLLSMNTSNATPPGMPASSLTDNSLNNMYARAGAAGNVGARRAASSLNPASAALDRPGGINGVFGIAASSVATDRSAWDHNLRTLLQQRQQQQQQQQQQHSWQHQWQGPESGGDGRRFDHMVNGAQPSSSQHHHQQKHW